MTVPAPASPGNRIVPTPGSVKLDFPTLVLGGIVVSTAVYLVSEQSRMAGWTFTILLLLAIAYSHKNFADEIGSLLSGQ